MSTAPPKAYCYRTVIVAALITGQSAWSAPVAEPMSPAKQTSLVQKYCAACHTDAVKNGGLSLQHYDAAQPDPALAAMLLSKLRNGAMGAAGLGSPDPATGEAWIAATAAQAEKAKAWTLLSAETSGQKGEFLTASIVRDVPARKPSADAPVYRLILTCDATIKTGQIQLTWSPSPQVDRTFSVSADGQPGIPHKLEGRETKMGNGANLSSGLASAMLSTPLPQNSLTVSELFPGETVVFPFGDLNKEVRDQLAVCLAGRTGL